MGAVVENINLRHVGIHLRNAELIMNENSGSRFVSCKQRGEKMTVKSWRCPLVFDNQGEPPHLKEKQQKTRTCKKRKGAIYTQETNICSPVEVSFTLQVLIPNSDVLALKWGEKTTSCNNMDATHVSDYEVKG